MSQFFNETAHNRTDKKKYNENFDSIDWGDLKSKPIEKKVPKRGDSAGLCGEFGMSTFDKEAYDANFDAIRWTPERMATPEELEEIKGDE